MKKYSFSARDNSGKEIKGNIEARDETAVAEILHDRGLIVVNVKEKFGLDLEMINEINIGGVPMKEKVVFMRQMATMVGAGLPLTRALEIMEQQIENAMFRRVISDVRSTVESGKGLAEAFRAAKGVFDDITINLIEAGESSGNLDVILEKLAVELENNKTLGDKLRGALIYPIIILVVVIAVVVLLLVVLVPSMAEIYEEFDSELPAITLFLVNMSNFFLNFWWAVLLVVTMLIGGGKMYFDTPKGSRNRDKIILKIPIVGMITKKMQLAQFTRILGLLLSSGLSIIRALELTSQSLSNQMYREVVLSSRDEVEKGGSLAIPIARSEYFPLLISSMIAVGEETGELDTVLEKVSQYYNEEVKMATANMSAILEPFFLVLMGVVIGFIAMAVYMPMFQLSEVMSLAVDIVTLIV